MFFVKSFICFIILPTIFILFFLCAGLFIYLFLLFKGIFYISILIGIPFAILLVLTILEVLINFVINGKTNEKRLMITFLVSVVGLGASFGIFLLDLNSVEYVDEVPISAKTDTLSKTYTMTDDMYFSFGFEAEYIIDNTLTNEVKVEVDYYKNYTEILLPEKSNGSFVYYEKPYIFMNQYLVSIMIEDLKHKKFYNYGMLNEIAIRIYTTEQNIQILKANHEKEEDRKIVEESNCSREIQNYEGQISRLEEEKRFVPELSISNLKIINTTNECHI